MIWISTFAHIVMNMLLFLSLYVALICTQCSARNLKLIQVVFRHGDRAPFYELKGLYPVDPYLNETWYPEGWGGLTNGGKKRAYELGVFLRDRYGKWLGDVYLKDNVVFESSNYDRNIMSTQLLAAGLFPPSKIQRWDSELDWQPIPVISEALKTKNLYMTQFTCRKFKAMRRELEETDKFLVHRAAGLSKFFDFVSVNVGTKIEQQDIGLIYSQLSAQLNENKTLPKWTEGIFPEGKLEQVAAYDYVIRSYNKTMTRISGGSWIRELLKNIDGHLNGTQGREQKGFFYGAHDSNIAAILTTLGVFTPHVPYYSSAIIIELSEIEDELYLKVLYRNKGNLQELLIPGCESFDCPLDKFRELFADIVASDKESSSYC